MKTDPLDSLLREPVPSESPRPGFETRLQAIATENVSKQKPSGFNLAWLGCGALALIALGLFLIKQSPSTPESTPVITLETPPTFTPSDSLAFVKKSPMHREMQALQSDAEKTVRFLVACLPSVPKEL